MERAFTEIERFRRVPHGNHAAVQETRQSRPQFRSCGILLLYESFMRRLDLPRQQRVKRGVPVAHTQIQV